MNRGGLIVKCGRAHLGFVAAAVFPVASCGGGSSDAVTTTSSTPQTTTTVALEIDVSELPVVSAESAVGDVRVAQQLVSTLSDPISVDGSWGSQTSAAVGKLRVSLGLSEEGVVDADVWSAALDEIDFPARLGSFGAETVVALRNAKVPTGVLLIGVSETPDESSTWSYVAPKGVDVDEVVAKVQELNPPTKFDNWRFCSSKKTTEPLSFTRSWWASSDKKLSIVVTSKNGRGHIDVTEMLNVNLDGCNGYASKNAPSAASSKGTTPNLSWPPSGFQLAGLDVAFRFLKPGEVSCGGVGGVCYGMELVTLAGCSSLYVELTVLDASGANIGMTNDLRSNVRAGERVIMRFSSYDVGAKQARVEEVTCL
jgi:hypothetical protein